MSEWSGSTWMVMFPEALLSRKVIILCMLITSPRTAYSFQIERCSLQSPYQKFVSVPN